MITKDDILAAYNKSSRGENKPIVANVYLYWKDESLEYDCVFIGTEEDCKKSEMDDCTAFRFENITEFLEYCNLPQDADMYDKYGQFDGMLYETAMSRLPKPEGRDFDIVGVTHFYGINEDNIVMVVGKDYCKIKDKDALDNIRAYICDVCSVSPDFTIKLKDYQIDTCGAMPMTTFHGDCVMGAFWRGGDGQVYYNRFNFDGEQIDTVSIDELSPYELISLFTDILYQDK